MGKTHLALERAEKEFRNKKQEIVPEQLPPVDVARDISRDVSPSSSGDQYDHLKINLFNRFPDNIVRTLLFAGCKQGSGVSTTVINFASTLVKNPKLDILLIDANLRSPSLHSKFRVKSIPGLVDFLTGDDSTISSIKVGQSNLHLLPCGSYHHDPVSLFSSERFELLLEKACESFDFVIFDTPPINDFPECCVLADKMDGTVLVVEFGKTRKHNALTAKKQLEETGSKILGIVINKRKYYIPPSVYRQL